MFVDASAIVAILKREPEADALTDALDTASSPVTSPTAVFEAVLGICRKRHASVAESQRDVLDFLTVAGIHIGHIGAREAETALDAGARYGKGRGHPAQLNLGDCFAYASEKSSNFTPVQGRGLRQDRCPIRNACTGVTGYLSGVSASLPISRA